MSENQTQTVEAAALDQNPVAVTAESGHVGPNLQAAQAQPTNETVSKAFRKLGHSTNRRQGDVIYNPMRYLGQFINEGRQLGFLTPFRDKDGQIKVSISARPDGGDEGRMVMLLAKDLRVPAQADRELMNITYSVQGAVDENGNRQAVLVARAFSATNYHQTNARSLLELTKLDDKGHLKMLDPEEQRRKALESLRRGNTEAYNQIQVSGIVVGFDIHNIDGSQRSADGTGKMPWIEIHLRQDANPENIIPLRIISSNIDMTANLLQNCFLRPMTFYGSHKLERLPVFEKDEAGNIVTENGLPLQKTDGEGNLVWMYNSYIKVTREPADAQGRDILFLTGEFPIPIWLERLAAEAQQKREEEDKRREERRKLNESVGQTGTMNISGLGQKAGSNVAAMAGNPTSEGDEVQDFE